MLTDNQNREYSQKSFEELCDLLDERQDEIDRIKEQVEQMESAINSLQNI